MTIYFDLDDVLAHFMPYVNSHCDTNYKVGEMLDLKHWEYMRTHHQRMFANLQPNHDAIDVMYNILRHYDVQIRALTALPFDDHSPWQYATLDKVRWCDQHIQAIPMFVGPYAHDKWRHCTPGDLLIDDKRSNCDEWEAAGGKAYLYRGDNEDMKMWIVNQLKDKS